MSRWVDNLLYKMRKRRFCKLNGWFCPDCIYQDFIFEGAIFRGNKCRYPRQNVGKWVKISPAEIYECSQCGQNVMTSDIEAYKFCHGCGAKMIGGDEDEEPPKEE